MLCVFRKVGSSHCFGSHSFRVPVADVEAVASRSTLPFISYVNRVRDVGHLEWAWNRLYLAIRKDDAIISRQQRNHAIKASIFRLQGTAWV